MPTDKLNPVVKVLRAFKRLTSEEQQTALAFIREEMAAIPAAKLARKPRSTAKPLIEKATE